MTRALLLEEFTDEPPELPELREVPEEPHPEFARIYHWRVCWCSKCRAHFSGLWRIDRVQMMVAAGGASPYTVTWAETNTACPHCQRTEWVQETDKVKRENGTLRTRHLSEQRLWQIREDARNGVLPGRRRRAIRLEEN